MERADRTSINSPTYIKMRERQEYFASEGGIETALDRSGCRPPGSGRLPHGPKLRRNGGLTGHERPDGVLPTGNRGSDR